MRLSALRSWLGARENDLILGPSLVWAPRARLSRRYRTHAAWRQNLSPAQAACTFGSSGTGHRLLQYPTRALHSSQSVLERCEPLAVSLDPAEATTGFQQRRTRARQIAEAKASENAAAKIAKSRYTKPEPKITSDSKNTKLDTAIQTRAAKEARRRGQAEPPWVQNQDHHESVIQDRSIGHEDQLHFDYWAPAITADAVHVEALQKAHEAARKAEDLARQAEELTASAAAESHNEEYSIGKALAADIARTQAERAASDAKRMALHAAEKGNVYEAIRAELLAAKETQPKYLDKDYPKISQVTSGRRLRASVLDSCRICHGPHSLSRCKVLFEDLPTDGFSNKLQRERRLFQERLTFDEDMREAMPFILSKFTVSRGSPREVVPLDSKATVDAPASARKYLQGLDNRVFFKNILGEYTRFKVEFTALPFNLHSGYYITTNDDGSPLTVVYNTNAPSNITTDPNFQHEIQKFQTFIARWKRGEKSSYGQDPFPDLPCISIIICLGRWHRTTSYSSDPWRSVITLGISNEKLWNQGLFYKGIHIGTEDDKITSEYKWWSYGRAEVEGARWIDLKAAPEHTSTSQISPMLARGLLRATLRNVKESVRPILSADVKRENHQERRRFLRYTADAVRRASRKYGRDSEQYRVLKVLTDQGQGSKEALLAMIKRKWAPSWETMMRLEQDQPELDPRQPLPPPRTLRRQRLLRPRSPPTSALTAGQRWHSKFRMKSIISDDVVAGNEDISSETKMLSKRAPGFRRPSDQGYRTNSLSSPDSSRQRANNSFRRRHLGTHRPWHSNDTPDTKGVSSKAEGRRERPVSQARRNRPSKKYVPQSLIWW